MDDPILASKVIDRIAAAVMPEIMAQIGDAYLRGYPFFIGHDADGLNIRIIPADELYAAPQSPLGRK